MKSFMDDPIDVKVGWGIIYTIQKLKNWKMHQTPTYGKALKQAIYLMVKMPVKGAVVAERSRALLHSTGSPRFESRRPQSFLCNVHARKRLRFFFTLLYFNTDIGASDFEEHLRHGEDE